MVCQSEANEENPLCSHSHIAPTSQEQEMASETSAFLPGEEEENVTRGNSRRASRNLGILVITEGFPLEPDKSNGGVQVAPYIPTTSCADADSDCETGGVVAGGNKVGPGSKSCCSAYVGILLTLASGLVFTLSGVIVKCMQDYHPFTLAMFRFQGLLLPSLGMVLYARYVQKIQIFETIWPPTGWIKGKRAVGLIVRCTFGTGALFLHFYALQRLDVADAAVIGSCQPVFVTLAAYIFLGEACGIFPVFTALLTIVGVGVISRPSILTGKESFEQDTLVGAAFSMSSMFMATMVFVIIRYLKDIHFTLLTFIFGCWGTVQSIVCALAFGQFKLPQSGEDWWLAIALAGVTLLGQVGLTLALQCEQAGPVALVRTCDCIFAFILQFILLDTVPDLYSLTGASIIIFCVVLTAFRKWISTLPGEHAMTKKFWFVMM